MLKLSKKKAREWLNSISIVITIVSIITIMLCLTVVMYKIQNDKFTNTLIGNNTIYLIDRQYIDKYYYPLNNNDNNSVEQKFFIDSVNKIPIRDLPNLDIVVDLDNNYIKIKNKNKLLGKSDDYDIEYLYNIVKTELIENSTIYKPLYNILEFDKSGNLVNFYYEKDEDAIIYDGSNFNKIDIRFLDIQVAKRDSIQNENKLVENSSSIKLTGIQNIEDIEAIVFKPEAIYGVANTELGIDVFEKLQNMQGTIWIDSNKTGVYQVVSRDDMLSTFEIPKKDTGGFKELNIEELNKTERTSEINVFFDTDTDKFKNQTIELLESLGFEVNEVDNINTCDLTIRYTWIYSDSFQSSLDKELDTAIQNYCLAGEDSSTIEFMFRSAWEVTN